MERAHNTAIGACNLWDYSRKTIGIASSTMNVALHALEQGSTTAVRCTKAIKACSYTGIIGLPFDTYEAGVEAVGVAKSALHKDGEGALFSLYGLGILIGDNIWTTASFIETAGLFESPLLAYAAPLGVALMSGRALLASVKTVQTLLFCKRLTADPKKLEELIGTEEETWKHAQVERRTSKKALDSLRKLLKGEGNAEQTIKDVKKLCKRLALRNCVEIAANILIVTALVLFLVGFVAAPPLPFILLGLGAAMKIGLRIYDSYLLERGLFETPEKDKVEECLDYSHLFFV